MNQIIEFHNGWHSLVNDFAISGGWTFDGKVFVVSDASGGVYVFNGDSGKQIWIRSNSHEGGTLATSIHPTENKFVTTGHDGKVLIWDVYNNSPLKIISVGSEWVENVSWSKDGKLFAVSCSKKVHIFDSIGDEVWVSDNHRSTVSNIEWSLDGELATSCYGCVSFFDGESGKQKQKLEWKGSLISMVLSPNGDIVVCGSQDNTVHFWRRSTEQDSMMSGYPLKPSNLAFDESGVFLATGGGENITVWSFKGEGPEGTTPLSLKFHSKPITSLVFANRCMNLASGARDGTLAIWGLREDSKEGGLCDTRVNESISNLYWRYDDNAIGVLDRQGGVTIFFRGKS